MDINRPLTIEEIDHLIETARAKPINANGTGYMWDMLPRIPYDYLPEQLQREADKITVELAKRFLFECYPVGHFDKIAADPSFNEKIEQALHSAKYLIESTDLTPPEVTGNEAVDRANYEDWRPVSLIGSDFVEAWEKITSDVRVNQAVINNNLLAGFLTTHENRAFNELTKFTRSLPGENMTIDELLHQGTISGEYVEMQTPLSKDNTTILSPWTVSTSQLFDRLIVEFTETGAKSRVITLSLDDYMQSRGLKDRKETRKQVKSDLHTLRTSAVSFKEYSGKGKKRQEVAFTDVNIAEAVGIDRNGKIMLTLTPSIYELLKQSYVMPLPQECQKINSKRNPNSYNLLRKIAEHKNMNIGKPNEDIISVATLLKCCPAIPSYEKVKNSDRHFTDRIIDPFCRDMDALKTISWEFCNANNEPLTDRQLAMNYDVFSKLNVHITWQQYPDQTARLEKKAAAKQKKSPSKRGVTHRTKGGNNSHKGG